MEQMPEMGYNTGVNLNKSSGARQRHRYFFSKFCIGEPTVNYSATDPYFPENLDDYAPWVATHGLRAPYGKCQCGCGEKTSISSDNQKGRRVGHPSRFCMGHWARIRPVKLATDVFWSNVERQGVDDCWEWQAARNNKGYGSFHGDRMLNAAHRFSYELHYGSISLGSVICHSCDNPSCVNPAHLFMASQSENIKDAMRKGRWSDAPVLLGEKHPKSRLTEEDVRDIRCQAERGVALRQIAEEKGTSYQNVKSIVSRRTWGHLV